MTLEAAIAALEAKIRKPRRFKELCEDVFQTPMGQELLAMLCTVANPVDQSFCADSRLAAQLSGNREVVAALWRYGAATNSVPGIHPTNHNDASETKRQST